MNCNRLVIQFLLSISGLYQFNTFKSNIVYGSYSESIEVITKINQPFCLNFTYSQVVNESTFILRRLSEGRQTGHCKGTLHNLHCDHSKKFWKSKYPVYFEHSLQSKLNRSKIRVEPSPWLTIGHVEFYGNDFLDYLIFQLFFQKNGLEVLKNGTFLEAGATNGLHASNTLFFDAYLDWKGILIEPSPCAICQLPYNRYSHIYL